MKSVAGIQARCSSTRLPGKVLADLAGEPLIVRVWERVRAADLVDEAVVLTSTDPSDDRLVRLLEGRRIPVRRGPLGDVMARYEELLAASEADYVVRVTGDCPLVDPTFVDLQLGALRAFDGDLAVVDPGFEGTLGGQTALSARALRRAAASSDPLDREHVGSFWLRAHRGELRCVGLDVDPSLARPGLRLQVDEAPDLDLIRAIYEAFADEEGAGFALKDALGWLDEHPEVARLNREVRESEANRRLRELHRVPVPVGRWP